MENTRLKRLLRSSAALFALTIGPLLGEAFPATAAASSTASTASAGSSAPNISAATTAPSALPVTAVSPDPTVIVSPPPLFTPSPAPNTPAARATTLFTPAPSATPTSTAKPVAVKTPPPPPQMKIAARSILYDGDRFLLIAHDNVDIEVADGMHLRGRYFAMDIRANRYIIAGHISLTRKDGTNLQGAAYANFLDFGRAYYLPVINGPDRWTIADNDFAHPLRGRLNPGDAFLIPDEPHGRAFIKSRHAVVVPNTEIRFDFAELNTGLAVVPVPNYVLNLSKNPNFAQNSLNGARYDASYPFAGSANSSTVFHIREAVGSGLFGAVEQRIVGKKAYLVGSIAPIDKELKQYNLLGLEHASPKLQIEGFAQESTFQQGFAQPLNASAYLNGRVTQSLRSSYLQFNVNQYYQSLLGQPPTINGCTCTQGNAEHAWVPDHSIDTDLSWIGFDQRINKLPLHYRLRSDYGYSHNRGYGVIPAISAPSPSAIFGVGVPTVTHNTEGFTLYTSSIRVNRDRHGRDLNFNMSLDDQREQFSLPHHVITANTNMSLSKTYGTKAATFLSYGTSTIGDNYGANQTLAYPSALTGYGTTHSLAGSVILTPTPDFNLTFIATHSIDVLGGRSNSLSGEVRARVLPHLTIDISRAYYFGPTVTQRWSPQFGLLIGG